MLSQEDHRNGNLRNPQCAISCSGGCRCCVIQNLKEVCLLERECFKDPLFSFLLGVYVVADAATGRVGMDWWGRVFTINPSYIAS